MRSTTRAWTVLLPALLLVPIRSAGQARTEASAPRPGGAATFPLAQVRLLDGPFARAQELNLQYIRALEIDRLLAPFRAEAGLPAKAAPYPNWESSGLGGHTAG